MHENQTAFSGESYEDATVGILVVQVRLIRTISGDVFQRATCPALVTKRRRLLPAAAMIWLVMPETRQNNA
jgi:hypothetical protein